MHLQKRLPNVKSGISKASGAQADILYEAGDAIQFGSQRLEVLFTPGVLLLAILQASSCSTSEKRGHHSWTCVVGQHVIQQVQRSRQAAPSLVQPAPGRSPMAMQSRHVCLETRSAPMTVSTSAPAHHAQATPTGA